MQRPECQYFRKERYPTNEDETHFEIIPWCDCNGRPDHTDHAKLRDALVQALEGAMRISSLWRITEPVSVEHEEEAKALQAMYNAFSAALALAKESK